MLNDLQSGTFGETIKWVETGKFAPDFKVFGRYITYESGRGRRDFKPNSRTFSSISVSVKRFGIF